jgi:hypothetical protein
MVNFIKSLFNPLRIKIPYLFDVLIVSDPDHIKKIETSGDIDRLHAYDTAALPWWAQFYFKATKFHDDQRDLWFCPLEPTSNPSYKKRRAYLEAKVSTGYSDEDVRKIAALLHENVDDERLAYEMVQIVNHRFFEAEIPLSITQAAKYTLQNLGEAILPWKYSRGIRSQQQIMDYCAASLPQDVHILDIGHNIGEVVQATAGALRLLKANLDRPVEEIFTLHAPTPQVPRIAAKSSTFDGLLWLPTSPGKTVILFQIGKAAAMTGDLLFTFGTGGPERVCVFKGFFLGFMQDLQRVLRETESER